MLFWGHSHSYISGYIPSYTDAFFETMSGFTTTGASIYEYRTITAWITILALFYSLDRWYGDNLVIPGDSTAPGVECSYTKQKSLVLNMTNCGHGSKTQDKILWEVYLLITVVEIILLYVAGMNLFDAMCHTFGTMATGGFSTKNASIGHYNNAWIDYINYFYDHRRDQFFLHYKALRGKVSTYSRDPETRFFLLLIGAGEITDNRKFIFFI